MKIVIDNNIMLDALLDRQPFSKDAKQILTACADTNIGYISANSLTDIFYVLRKLTDNISAKAAIKKLTDLFEVISVDKEDCIKALSLSVDDFEDALIIACAVKADVDFIVTRDKLFLEAKSPTAIVTPSRLIVLHNVNT